MKITVNNQPIDVREDSSLTDLLLSKNLVPDRIVASVNGEILDRNQYDATKLSDGDALEILSFVGGG